MKLNWVVILLLISNVGFSQNEANIWYFGENAGLDFNSGSPIALIDGQLNTIEGCSSIADANGDLLFYTDGSTIWNRLHQIMPNGTGLNGHASSTNAAIIIPKPESSNIYYIFTLDERGYSNGLQYSEVDMNLNGGNGDITNNKNILLETPVAEKITAIKISDEDAFWVVAHKWNSTSFISYKVTNTGINMTPVVSSTGSFLGGFTTNSMGAMKISPNGTKLAVANFGLWEAQLLDFNELTGVVSNALTILSFNNESGVMGIEFSPNSNVLYASVRYKGIYQFDLTGSNTDIINSETQIGELAISNSCLQLASDGKIYLAVNGSYYLDVINNPDIIGTGCTYLQDAVYLEGKKSSSGLPPFIQSFFNVVFQTDDVCLGESTIFTITNLPTAYDSLIWDFGDGNTSTLENPSHVYTSAGDYIVTLTITVGSESSIDTKVVTIYDQPTATLPLDILECDTNNEGFFEFDLTAQDVNILNGQSATTFEIVYYASMLDYTSNIPITNPTTYTNVTAYTSENIIASVRNRNNSDCEAMTDFNIQVFDMPMPNLTVPAIEDCDNISYGTDIDGIILFDLTDNESIILNGQSAIDFTVNYYTDVALLNEITIPSNYQNANSTETIYVQVVNNNNTNCTAETSFTLEVFELPTITPIVTLSQCDDDVDGYSAFNLNETINEITANAINETITFYESQIDAQNGNSPITNTSAYINENVSTDSVWARVENSNGCYRTAQVNLVVSTTQIPLTFTRDFYACDDIIDGDSTNGISSFNFSSVTTEIEALFPVGQQLIISYYTILADALSENNPIVDITDYRNVGNPNTQDIYIRVDSLLDNDCLGLGQHITLNVEMVPVANPVSPSEQCDDDGDGMYAFDTTNIESTLLNGQTNVIVEYTAENGSSLPSPLPNPFTTLTQTITVRVTNATSQDSDGACFDETTISFNVDAAAVAYPVPDIMVCDDNNDGLYAFDTSMFETTILNGQTGMQVTYTDENGNELASPLPNPFISESQTITVRVENIINSNCYSTTSFNLVVVDMPVLQMDEQWSICEGGSVEIIADAGFDEYLWSTGETTQSIVVDETGTYEIIATNIYGDLRCEDSMTITVVQSDIAIITNIETIDWSQNNNEIIVSVTGNGEYEYSIDGIHYQNSNHFTNLNAGEYTVYVRDRNGCGIVIQEIYLMYYPKFFTPNNDGYQDYWQLYGSKNEPNNIVYIYDRYGKLLKQLNPLNIGWDGTFNGNELSTSDFWFVLRRQNGKQYRGHFTLKR